MKVKALSLCSGLCLLILSTGCVRENKIKVTRSATGNPFAGAPITLGGGSNASGLLQQSNTPGQNAAPAAESDKGSAK